MAHLVFGKLLKAGSSCRTLRLWHAWKPGKGFEKQRRCESKGGWESLTLSVYLPWLGCLLGACKETPTKTCTACEFIGSVKEELRVRVSFRMGLFSDSMVSSRLLQQALLVSTQESLLPLLLLGQQNLTLFHLQKANSPKSRWREESSKRENTFCLPFPFCCGCWFENMIFGDIVTILGSRSNTQSQYAEDGRATD